jgi:hypothetical protein
MCASCGCKCTKEKAMKGCKCSCNTCKSARSGKKTTKGKTLSAGQKKIASAAGNPNKIEGADFKALRKGK